ncbi:MAG: hypothetical protein JO053_07305, partial [Acidobacteria bacterium]|nr:hypothetical protein [Acidobacteriota bacterium]
MFKACVMTLVFVFGIVAAVAQAPVYVPGTPSPTPDPSAVQKPADSLPPASTPPTLQNTDGTGGTKPPTLKSFDANISTATPQSSGTPSAKPSPTPDDEIIKVETNLITTPVSVLDRNGRFIAG